MANHIYVATSLDGFIATKDQALDWLYEIPNPAMSDYGYAEFMRGIDAIVMGRNTFETILTFDIWPYDRPTFILSNRLKELPEHIAEKAELIKGNLNQLIAQLNQQGYSSLYIDGGKTVQSFLEEDLIDSMTITRIPVLLGDGLSLFSKLDHRLKFKHQKTEIFNDTLVKSLYIRDRQD